MDENRNGKQQAVPFSPMVRKAGGALFNQILMQEFIEDHRKKHDEGSDQQLARGVSSDGGGQTHEYGRDVEENSGEIEG
ncbi:hypothetical protein D3C75_969770 [compost metagenome]